MIFYTVISSRIYDRCTFPAVFEQLSPICYRFNHAKHINFAVIISSIRLEWFLNPNDYDIYICLSDYLSRHCLPVLPGILNYSPIFFAMILHLWIFASSRRCFSSWSYSGVHAFLSGIILLLLYIYALFYNTWILILKIQHSK